MFVAFTQCMATDSPQGEERAWIITALVRVLPRTRINRVQGRKRRRGRRETELAHTMVEAEKS